MAKAAKHPGDDGKWHQEGPERMSIRERIGTGLGVTSPQVVEAMRAEDAFLRSIPDGGDVPKRFTDRRPPVDRSKLIP